MTCALKFQNICFFKPLFLLQKKESIKKNVRFFTKYFFQFLYKVFLKSFC